MPNPIPSAASDNSIKLERLEQDRRTLLDVINKPISAENGDGRALKALRERYNEIMEMKDSLQRPQSLDPTEVLPPELYAAIFFEASAAAAIDKYDASSEDLLLRLTLVSKRWCEIILDTPWLWTRITVVKSGADTLAKLATCLALSQSAPLRLELDVRPLFDPLLADVVATLLPHTHRIISVNADGIVMTSKIPSHLDALFAPGNFPSIQSIALHSFDATLLQRLIDGSSFVTSIKNLAPLVQVIGHSNHNAFRELHIEASLDDFLPFLPNFPSLEHLEVRDIHAGLQTRNHDRTATKHDTIKYFGCSEVPSDDPVTALDFLAIFPYLSTLKVSMTWMHVYRLLSTFGDLPSLSDLQIAIHPSTVGTTIPPTNLRTSRVKRFAFDNISERERKADHVDFLFRYCEEYMPLLESLQMTLGGDIIQPLDLSTASLGSLLDLKVKLLEGNVHSKVFSFISPTIRVLDIETGDSDCQLGIQCPQLTKLRFARVGFGNEIAFPALMDAQNLHTLELDYSAGDGTWPWDRADLLRNLKKISTKDPTPLLIHLINRPEDYPLLEKLSLCGNIEWDWLFLMLERRNFLPTSAISPIISLELEWAIPLYLIRSLSHLLRGRYTTRPPNEELSLLFMTRLGRQLSVNGCWRCLDTLQACDNMAHGIFRGEFEPAVENTENTDVNSFPDSRYPLLPSVLLWLKGEKARDEEQRRPGVTNIARILECELHKKSKRTRITGFSLPESPGVYTSLASQQFSSFYEET